MAQNRVATGWFFYALGTLKKAISWIRIIYQCCILFGYYNTSFVNVKSHDYASPARPIGLVTV